MKKVITSFNRLSIQHRLLHSYPLYFFAKKTVKVPSMGDSITQGGVQSYEKKIGEYVALDEVVAMVETDKITVDIRSPEAGTLTQLFAKVGDTIEVGSPFFEIDTDGKKADGPAKPAAEAPKQAEAPKKEAKSAEAPKKVDTPPPKPAEKKTDKPAPAPLPVFTGQRKDRREPMSRMRLKIAQRLKDAQNTYASLTTFQECDMSAVMTARKELQDDFSKKNNVKLGFMSFFIKAAVQGLKNQPIINAVIDGNDIVFREYVDISVAVATPKGLMVPVIRNCEQLSFADIERVLIDLANKGKSGKINPDDMAGGTFTISNGGVFGSMMGTPIINAPQSSILGMHAIINRPVVRDNQIVARPMMYLALTYDHRIMDGREAAIFLKSLATNIEDPRRLLLDL